MDDSRYEGAMQIIMHAGNAKSSAMLAIDAAEQGDFDAADAQLKEAQTEMTAAHKVQFDLVRAEAAGKPVEVNIILVHAQDHLTMAIMSIDMARKFIALQQRMAAFEAALAVAPEAAPAGA